MTYRTAAVTVATALIVLGCATPEQADGPAGTTPTGLPEIVLYGPEGGAALPVELDALGTVEPRSAATAYRLEVPGELAELGAQLAELLGLPPGIVEKPSWADEWGAEQLVFGEQDGPHLYLSTDGAWYYSANLDTATYDCTSVDGDDDEGCVLAVLGPDEVGELAAEVVERLGLGDELTPFEAGVFDGGYAEAQLLVAGEPSGLWFGFGFSPSGQLAYAYGQLARPVAVGEYPLLSVEDTARRLAGSLGDWYPHDAVVVRPVSATFALFPFFDVDGRWWLLPGYRFALDNGDEFIEQAVSPTHLRLVPHSSGELAQPDTAPSAAAEALAERVIGMSEQDAAVLLQSEPFPWRIVRREQEWLAGTMDFIANRLNLELDRGVVTVVTFG